MSVFPPELYDLIISNCERRSLISCGLVDRGWMELSRPHLFRAVMLNDTNYEGFLRLLAMENTTFRPLIRQLTISRPEADGKDTFFGGDFVQQLAVLDAVRRLRIFHVPWVGISASSIDTFGRVFRGITSLVLARTTFSSPYELICMLGPLRALEEIAIHGTFIDDFPAEGHLPKGPAPPAGLTTVRLKIRSNEGDPFTYLAMWLVGRPPPLRVLEAGVLWRESIPGVGALCSAIGAGLKELDLVLLNHVTANDVETHLKLSENPNLERLTIHIGLRRFHAPSMRPHAPWAVLAAVASLKALTLVLTIDYIYMFDALDWPHLNATLRSHADLRTLHFLVNSHNTISDQDKLVAPELRGRVADDVKARVEITVEVIFASRLFTNVI